MKITRTTETYIRSLIAEKAKGKIDSLEKTLSNLKKEEETEIKKISASYDKEVKKIEDECGTKVLALMKKYGIALHKSWNGDENVLPQCNIHNSSVESLTTYRIDIEKTEKELNDVRMKVEKKSTEVIARLALGGTADDLDKMLAKIKF